MSPRYSRRVERLLSVPLRRYQQSGRRQSIAVESAPRSEACALPPGLAAEIPPRDVRGPQYRGRPQGPDPRCFLRLPREEDGDLLQRPEREGEEAEALGRD
ncbi:hypothetical protein chiPu_0025591 [Chiloscyllium punctatum]|uniref:Uncharacterized protein n=1 Tax=Chiloscyllium punctatum TaxID=137246 RepID=A0A401TGI6_CHIPU|nr:hypothetical protein [Chiloscyllium punctatum]